MSTFSLFATVTASTKRAPDPSGGKRGAATTNLSTLKCLPLDPLSPEIAHTLGVEAPHEMLQTFVEGGLDIVEGDRLVVDSTEYRIRAVGEWYWPMSAANTSYLVLEEIKGG